MLTVYGTVCLDRVHHIDRLPPVGGYAEIRESHNALGGEAANTASALHRWHTPVHLVSNALGSGPDGDLLRQLLNQSQISWEEAARAIEQTPVCDIYVTADGERTMFGRGFSTMEQEAADEAVKLSPGSWITLDCNHGTSARRLARRAIQEGSKVYLLDFIRPDDPKVPGLVWQSSTDWAGERENTAANLDLARSMAMEHGLYVILTDGHRGLVTAIPSGERRYLPAYQISGTVDTTGAGDAFRAGVLYGLEREWSWGDCLSFGAVAGGLNSLASGAINPEISVEQIQQVRQQQLALTEEYRQLNESHRVDDVN